MFQPEGGDLVYRYGLFRAALAHEPEVFAFLAPRMQRYEAVVEVGANVGVYSVFFGKTLRFQDHTPRVFSFEPARGAYAQLLKHLRVNDVRNVVPFNCAVARDAGIVALHENHSNFMSHSLDQKIAELFPGGVGNRSLTISARPEDLLALVRPFRHLLLKADVVGGEGTLLAALRPLIFSHKPDIVIGVWQAGLHALNQLDWLRDAYSYFKIEAQGLAPRREFSDSRYCNYALIPSRGLGK